MLRILSIPPKVAWWIVKLVIEVIVAIVTKKFGNPPKEK